MSLHHPQEYLYPDARDRQFLLFFHKGMKRTRFEVEKYNKLKDDIAEVQSLDENWMCFVLYNEPCSLTGDCHIVQFNTFVTSVQRPGFIPILANLRVKLFPAPLSRWSWI